MMARRTTTMENRMLSPTRPLLGLILLATLAACGADGAPEPPVRNTTQSSTGTSGLTVSGDARFGMQTRL